MQILCRSIQQNKNQHQRQSSVFKCTGFRQLLTQRKELIKASDEANTLKLTPSITILFEQSIPLARLSIYPATMASLE